jgi:RNA polymerase sigma factor (sigma-70 family)
MTPWRRPTTIGAVGTDRDDAAEASAESDRSAESDPSDLSDRSAESDLSDRSAESDPSDLSDPSDVGDLSDPSDVGDPSDPSDVGDLSDLSDEGDPSDEGAEDGLPGVTAALRRLVAGGLGPALGLHADWRRRSAIERVARLGAAELRRRLSVIYTEHHAAFVRHAARILGNRHDAEEVVNDAFARVLRADPDLDAPDALVAYLRRAVRNQAFDHGSATTRDRATRQPDDPDDLDARLASPDRSLADRVCDDITLAVELHRLSVRQRQCFALRYVDGLSVKETAARLGISEGNVKRICHEARARLAAAFEVAA